jgi:PKD repeat protein
MINVVTQEVTTLAGPKTGPSPGTTDGTLTAARFKKPKGIAVIDGIIYIADENVIRAIDVPNNSVTTFAGNRGSLSITNGTGSSAAFTEISDIQSDGQGNMYVSENSRLVASNVIRKVTIDNLAPTSNFTASKRDLLVDEATTLTNTSSGQASTSRTWTITPADYSIVSGSLTENTVEIKCSKTGFYEVSLSVTNEYGTDLTTKEDFLAVSNTGSITSYKNTDLVKLFPNPVNNELQLQFETGVLTNSSIVDIYHINGNKVMSIDPTQTVNTSALANGIYFVTVRTGELNYAKRFIVSHK